MSLSIRFRRVSVSSWVTTDADVERRLEAILRIAKQVTDLCLMQRRYDAKFTFDNNFVSA